MKQRGETFRISPLAGWASFDVRHYVGQALGDGTALSLHTCGGTGTGKSVLAALLSTATARRSPDQRSLLVTDVPGQDRDPRGVVTAASTADLSVVVVDARQGLSTPVKRDIVLLSLLGVRQIVLAINKIDLVEYTQAAVARVEDEYRRFAAGLTLPAAACVPVLGDEEDNVIARSAATPWYKGPTLLELLDAADLDDARSAAAPLLTATVQWVAPAGAGFAGTIVAGTLRSGDAVRYVQPSGRPHRMRRARIATPGRGSSAGHRRPVDLR